MDNRSLSHTRWKCQYHIVFIPKYRKRFVAQILVDIKKEQRARHAHNPDDRYGAEQVRFHAR